MTAQERRGQWIFLTFAGLLIAEELIGVGLALSQGLAQVNWWKSVARPLGFALGVAFLWDGETWLRWIVSVASIIIGSVKLLVAGRLFSQLAEKTPPEATGFLMSWAGYPLGIVGAIGLLQIAAGLAFLALPSVRAFFRYQRQRATASESFSQR